MKTVFDYSRILISGSSGFIGGHIYKSLQKHSGLVVGIGRRFQQRLTDENWQFKNDAKLELHCDLTDLEETKKVVAAVNPDIIIHCGAKATTKVAHPLDESEFIQQNIVATHNLLYAAHNVDVINLSTVLVYATRNNMQLGGEEKYDDMIKPLNPSTMYGFTKLAAENIINNSINVNRAHHVRLSAVVGAGTSHGMLRDFVKKAKSNSSIFEIYGKDLTHTCEKPYIHIDEVVKFVLYNGIINKKNGLHPKTKITNLISNSVEAVKVADIVQQIVGSNKGLAANGQDFWTGDVPYIYSDGRSDYITLDGEMAISIAVREILESEKE